MQISSINSTLQRISSIQTRMQELENLTNFQQQETVRSKKQFETKESNPSLTTKHTSHNTTQNQRELNSMIQNQAKKHGVSPQLISAIVKTESNGNPNAISKAGAIGLMQLMPKTAQELKVNPYNQEQNLDGGIRYLKNLAHKFQDLDLTLAAYNAGPETVNRYGGVPPYSETQNYIKKIRDLL